MTVEASSQTQTFVWMVLTGFVLAVLMDRYLAFFHRRQPRTVLLFILDAVYWLANAALVFYILVLGNWGEVRFYVFFGLAVGAAFYRFWFKQRWRRFLSRPKSKNSIKKGRIFWHKK